MERKAYEVADEKQLPNEKAPRAETSQVGAQRENQRYDHQGDDTVTANTDPAISVGQAVYSVVCISSAGAVKQTHYGSFEV